MTTIVPGKVPPPIVVKPNLKGDPGPPGEGVAPGGTIGQILAKVSSTDYDTTWINNTVVGTDLTYNPATRALASSTGADTTLPLVSGAEAGLAPASGGGTTNFLRADGTWAAPAGGGGSLTDGDKGDITVSASGATWTIDAGVVTLAKMANMATASFLGRTTAGTGSPEVLTAAQARAVLDLTESIVIAVGDETTAITTGTAKVTFRMPYAFTLTGVRASLTTASSSGLVTVTISEGGGSVLSTNLTIDASEKTSTTAATPAVISDSSLADDAEMTIGISTAGTGATGLKVTLIGRRT